MSALTEARERREAIGAFRDSMPWFEGQCAYGGKFADEGYDVERAYSSVLRYFNEMCAYVKRDRALCEELAVKLRKAYDAFKQGDEEAGRVICDAIWRMPELKKIR